MGRSAHLSKPSCGRGSRDAHAISAKSATPSAAAIRQAHPAAATSVRRRAAGAGKPSTSALARPVASPATVSGRARLKPRRPPALVRLSNRPASRECEERRSAIVQANRTRRVGARAYGRGELCAAPRRRRLRPCTRLRRAQAPSTRAARHCPLRPERVRRAAPHERRRRQPECRLSPRAALRRAEHVRTRGSDMRRPRCPAAASSRAIPSRSARRPRSG